MPIILSLQQGLFFSSSIKHLPEILGANIDDIAKDYRIRS
jgi:hypothetical protein